MNKIFIRILVYSFCGIMMQPMLNTTLLGDTPRQGGQRSLSTRDIHLNLEINNDDLLTVFRKIERITDFNFVYNSQDIDRNIRLKLSYQNASLYDILLDLSKNAKLAFKRVNSNINVRKLKKENTERVIEELVAISISGKVTAQADGQGLPGVNVLIKGSGTGTVTDVDGNYKLEVASEDEVLIFSFIGYVTLEEAIGGRKVIDVALAEDVQSLDEIVVTALGIKRASKSLTYGTQVIEGSSLEEAKETNLINSLQGKVAGLVLSKSATGPGGSTKVLLRGSRSITGNNQPLYVIDGVPMNSGSRSSGGTSFGGRDGGGGISMLNPDNIESMTVLKGASAAALYGSAGQNGAIVITTKSGKAGKINVDYNGGITFSEAMALPERQFEYGQGDGGAYSPNSERSFGPKTDGREVTLWNGNTVPYVGHPNNVEDFFRTAKTINNSISASGGNEKMRTFFSYGNVIAQGILRNNDMSRHNFLMKVDNNLSDKLSFSSKVNYIYQKIDNMPHTGEQGYALSSIYRSPSSIPLSEMKNFNYIDEDGVERQNYWRPGSSILSNPYWNLNREIFTEDKNRVLGLFSVRYEFTDWLSLQGRASIDRTVENTEQSIYNDTYTTYGLGSNYIVGDYTRQSTNIDALLSLNRDLSDKINLSANLGGSIQQGSSESFTIDSRGLNKHNYFFLINAKDPQPTNNYYQEPQIQSVYGTATVSYNNYLFLDATARNDWSSALPKENQSYFYPSIGLTGIISEMTTLPEWVTYGKVRASLAYSGSGGSAYRDRNYYSVARGGAIGTPSTRSLPDYKPEITSSFEVGAEWRFFDGRFGFDFTYYTTDTKNQLITIATPAASLFSNQYMNAGLINNHGVELTWDIVPIMTTNFKWDATFNFAKNKNKVIRLLDDVTTAIIVDDRAVRVEASEGGSFGDLYVVGWQRDEQGRPLVSADGLPMLTSGKSVYAGNYNPNYTLGFNNTFSYKNFSLRFLLHYNNGGTVIAGTQALLDADGHSKASLWGREEGIVLDAYTEDGEINTTSITSQSYFGSIGERYPAGEFYAYSGTALRVREAVLGYSFDGMLNPNGFIRGAKLSLVGTNLFFLIRKAPFDPEVVTGTGNYGGIEYNSLPSTRNIGFNVQLSF